MGLFGRTFDLTVHKNLLLVCGKSRKDQNQLLVATLNLEGKENVLSSLLREIEFELLNPKSPEEKRLESLFLSDKESDITFKVQGKLIPAHKEVLIQKSRYFANLFNSNQLFFPPPNLAS